MSKSGINGVKMNNQTTFGFTLFRNEVSRIVKYAVITAFALSLFLIPAAQEVQARPEPPNPSVIAYRPWVDTGPNTGRVGSQTTLSNCINVTLPQLIHDTQTIHGETVYDSGCKRDIWAQQYIY